MAPRPRSAKRPTAFAQRTTAAAARMRVALSFLRNVGEHAWARRIWVIPAAAAFIALVAASFAPALEPIRWPLRYGAAAALAVGAVIYLAYRSHNAIRRLSQEAEALRNEISRDASAERARLSEQSRQFGALAEAVKTLEKVLADANATGAQAAEITAKEIALLRAEIGARAEFFKALEQAAEKAAKETATLRAEIGAFNQRYGGLEEITSKLEAELQAASKDASPNNASLYQRFNRKLSAQHISIIENDWKKRLSLHLSRQTLGYMAHRACQVEAMLEGRFATSIEDVVLRALVGLAVKRAQIDVLEIGVLFGVGAAIMRDALAPHFETVHFTLIDPLDGYYDPTQKDSVTGQPVNEATLRRNLRRAGFRNDELTLIKRLSTEPQAISEAGAREYDILVIDGDHSYAGVKTDFENYARFVRLGGYIVFDDYAASEWPDIKRYVDEEVAPLPHLAPVGASFRTRVFRVARKDD